MRGTGYKSGERHHNSLVSKELVRTVVMLYNMGYSAKYLAESYGISSFRTIEGWAQGRTRLIETEDLLGE